MRIGVPFSAFSLIGGPQAKRASAKMMNAKTSSGPLRREASIVEANIEAFAARAPPGNEEEEEEEEGGEEEDAAVAVAVVVGVVANVVVGVVVVDVVAVVVEFAALSILLASAAALALVAGVLALGFVEERPGRARLVVVDQSVDSKHAHSQDSDGIITPGPGQGSNQGGEDRQSAKTKQELRKQ
eukprot:CAMPEP_0206597618 /NCGR_PEP_ID=MMETSP0325_2-20121206/44205_1 /ASSEMBLY_ACC=CAM_ASM_000347 /TAXON_ID=2866 /ORGANISM="Crypthecodinium cohnii, Strain Seligo" /LENGTH=184 /DNA_ID=CAMNT_0054108561 /DNA_START=273 /DNA_END=826 /DNA_ORIENTATION=+